METEVLLWIGGGIVAIYLFQRYQKHQKEGDGESGMKVPDERVSRQKVESILEDFTPKGTTEKDVQSQLNKFLRERIEHVRKEYTVEQGTRIDFDLGNGQVGIEVKMAKQLQKSLARQRMIGQIHTYIKQKYQESEVIILVATNAELEQDTAWKSDIEEDLEKAGASVIFRPIRKSR